MKSSLFLVAMPLAAMLLTAAGPHGHGRDPVPFDPQPRGRTAREDGYRDRPEVSRDYNRRDQDAAYAAMRHGAVLPLRAIEGRIMPRMPGATYLGPEFDAGSGSYRLKFMSRGSVSWIDVDGRTGAIIGRSGD